MRTLLAIRMVINIGLTIRQVRHVLRTTKEEKGFRSCRYNQSNNKGIAKFEEKNVPYILMPIQPALGSVC